MVSGSVMSHIQPIPRCFPNYNLLMNWGYDGLYDDGLYSVGATDNWYANYKNHQYLRTIYHNIH